MTLTIQNISQSYGTNLALFSNGYAMLKLWLSEAVTAMMPAKRMFVK